MQEALDRAIQGRTVIVIAHRLSTVKNADSIAVIEGGKIVEVSSIPVSGLGYQFYVWTTVTQWYPCIPQVGNHDTLSRKKGAYWKLITHQHSSDVI